MRTLAGYESPWVGLRRNKDGTPRDHTGELQALVLAGERGKAVDYFMTTMVGGPWFLPIVFRLMPRQWRQLRAVAHTLPYDAQVMGAQFAVPVEELASIAVPTLVMGGGRSPANMLAAQRRIAEAIPGSQHRILDGQTHEVAASALAPVLAEFFGG
jgi:pimeloyl-ACP methyl ester carboxylesterase